MSIDSDAYSDKEGEQTGLSESERHRLLAVERRRITLDVLEGSPLPVDLRELAEAIAAREGDDDGGSSVEEVMTVLYHHHLPEMAQMGLIDYDQERKRVEGRRMDLAGLTK